MASHDADYYQRLRQLVIPIIKGWAPEIAADMILGLVLNDKVLHAAQRDMRAAAAGAATADGAAPSGKRRGRKATGPSSPSAVALDSIDPNAKYTVAQAAIHLGMSEGHFRSFYATEEQKRQIEVVREGMGDGRQRVYFMGREILRVRALRIAKAA